MKPRIAFIVEDLKFGGIARVISLLISELTNYYHIELISLNDKQETEWTKILNIKIHTILKDETFRATDIGTVFRSVRGIRRIVIENRYVLVISSGYFVSVLSGLILSRYRVNTVMIQHADIIEELKKNNLQYFKAVLLKYSMNKLNAIVSVSSTVSKELKLSFNISDKKLFTINNPIDTGHIQSLAKEKVLDKNLLFQPGYFTFISVGRLSPEKNFQLLIKSFKKLHKLKDNIVLIIIGDGPEKNSLQNLIDKLHLADNVKLVGFKANPFKYMKISDCFVSSSSREGFGNVIVEAMTCGLPVIATNTSGSKDILYNRYGSNYGVMAYEKGYDTLFDSMNSILNTEGIREKYSTMSSKRYEVYDKAVVAHNYKNLIDSLL